MEIVERAYGFNWAALGEQRDGLAMARELFTADFEYQLDPAAFNGRTLEGVNEVQRFLEGIEADFRDFRQRPDRFIDAGEGRVVVLGEFVGRGRSSGLPFRSPFGHVWTVRDGRLARLEGYLDHTLALASVGLEP